MNQDHEKERMTSVTKDKPCVICEGDHKCSRGNGGLIICGRFGGDVEGYRYLGEAQGDPQFHLYRVNDGTERFRGVHPQQPHATFSNQWHDQAKRYARKFDENARIELANLLGLPVEVFASFPSIGVSDISALGRTFSFPECDAQGNVIGILERIPQAVGTAFKKTRKGSKRGIYILEGWQERTGPLLLVEGPTDTLALTAAGLCTIGRPSNTAGVQHLAELLQDVPSDRIIMVVGDNDQKPDGLWPGRDGAERTAQALAAKLKRTIQIVMPSDDVKDVREWLVREAITGRTWNTLGAELLAHFDRVTEPVEGMVKAEIVVTTHEHEVNDAAMDALQNCRGVYQRGGQLVHVLTLGKSSESSAVVRRPMGSVVVRELVPPLLRDRMTRSAVWFKLKETKEGELLKPPTNPPAWSVQAVHASGQWPSVRSLHAVVTHPILLGDGTLLTKNGYHSDTGVLMQMPVNLKPFVPDRPNRADAQQAASLLFDVVSDFPFEHPEHRAAWLAGLLTPLSWFAFNGPSPFFLIDGNVRGVGKGLLADTIALIVLGQRFSVMSYTHDRDELRKRITSVAVEGERLILLDNLAGAIGNDQLDAALTADRWKDRILGSNRIFDGPLDMVWYGTGNNCELRADTSRRTCHIRLESPAERPEERSGFRFPKLREHILRNRSELLTAALTILRAWIIAGHPRHNLPAWGSYESWSDTVREIVVFVGEPDPGMTRVTLQTSADRNGLAMEMLLQALRRIDPDRRGMTSAAIIEAAKHHDDLRCAVEDLAGKLETRALGYSLRPHLRRNFGNWFLDKSKTTGQGVRWIAMPIDEFHKRPNFSPSNCGDDGDSGDPQPRYASKKADGRLFHEPAEMPD